MPRGRCSRTRPCPACAPRPAVAPPPPDRIARLTSNEHAAADASSTVPIAASLRLPAGSLPAPCRVPRAYGSRGCHTLDPQPGRQRPAVEHASGRHVISETWPKPPPQEVALPVDHQQPDAPGRGMLNPNSWPKATRNFRLASMVSACGGTGFRGACRPPPSSRVPCRCLCVNEGTCVRCVCGNDLFYIQRNRSCSISSWRLRASQRSRRPCQSRHEPFSQRLG